MDILIEPAFKILDKGTDFKYSKVYSFTLNPENNVCMCISLYLKQSTIPLSIKYRKKIVIAEL